jgi:hypothetical protein
MQLDCHAPDGPNFRIWAMHSRIRVGLSTRRGGFCRWHTPGPRDFTGLETALALHSSIIFEVRQDL